MKITRIILLASALLCSNYVNLQAQYFGGSGDGYASATSREIVLVIDEITNFESVPNDFKLYQNYPNPFNPTTKISYSISESDFVSLKIYDMLGREIYTLVNEYKAVNTYNVDFNAANLSSGLYLYRLEVGDKYNEIKKMLLIK